MGTTVFRLTDQTRKNSEDDKADGTRELIVQLWYPAVPSSAKNPMPYLPDRKLLEGMIQEKYLDLSPDILKRWDAVETRALENVPILQSSKLLPLLIFSPGFGMSRVNYTAFSEDLASHGYIVATIDHPYSGLMVQSDDRIVSFQPDPAGPAQRVETMAQDVRFVLKTLSDGTVGAGWFATMIDDKRVGALGHSLGGATALELCRTDEAFSACADLDGDPFGKAENEGVKRPFLVVLNVPAESHRPPVAVREQRDQQWNALISKQKTPAFVITVNGTNHFSFSDIPFLVPESLMKKNGASISPDRSFEITSTILRAFFSRFLDDGHRDIIQTLPNRFTEITLKSFHLEKQ